MIARKEKRMLKLYVNANPRACGTIAQVKLNLPPLATKKNKSAANTEMAENVYAPPEFFWL